MRVSMQRREKEIRRGHGNKGAEDEGSKRESQKGRGQIASATFTKAVVANSADERSTRENPNKQIPILRQADLGAGPAIIAGL
jgi:hypothetical protein